MYTLFMEDIFLFLGVCLSCHFLYGKKSYLLSSKAFERYQGNLGRTLVSNDIREQDGTAKA